MCYSLISCVPPSLFHTPLLSLSLSGVSDNSSPTLPFCRLPSYSHSHVVFISCLCIHKNVLRKGRVQGAFTQDGSTYQNTHTHSRTTCWNRWTGKGTPTKSLSTYCFAINICQQRWSYYIKWNLQWLFCECFGSPAGCKPQRSKVTLCCNSSGFELGIYRGISIVHICFCVCFGRH